MKLVILDRDGTINSENAPTGQVRMFVCFGLMER